MFARVSTMQGSPDQVDELARIFQEQAVPIVRQLSGFKGTYWLANRQTGTVLGVALWESEEAMRASETEIEPRRKATVQAVGAMAGDIRRCRWPVIRASTASGLSNPHTLPQTANAVECNPVPRQRQAARDPAHCVARLGMVPHRRA